MKLEPVIETGAIYPFIMQLTIEKSLNPLDLIVPTYKMVIIV